MNHPLPQPGQLIDPAPALPIPRLLLAMRRMTAHGVRDAYAANMLIAGLGIRFRLPLVLLRAFILEIAQTSRRTIIMAPCCAMRMTADETLLLTALMTARLDPRGASKALREVTQSGAIQSPLSLAATLGEALGDTLDESGFLSGGE